MWMVLTVRCLRWLPFADRLQRILTEPRWQCTLTSDRKDPPAYNFNVLSDDIGVLNSERNREKQ